MMRIAPIISAALFIVLAFVSPLFAQSGQTGLQIAPAISEYAVQPGEQQQLQITVTNTSSQPEAVQIRPKPLVLDENIIIDQVDLDRYDASKWLSIEPSDVLIGGGDSRTISLTLEAPSDASPGGHYATVSFRALVDETENVKTVPELNALIVATVGGEINEQLAFSSKTQVPLLQFGRDYSLDAWVDNTGNVHTLPRVRAVLYKNNQEVQKLEASPALTLPGSQRKFEFNSTQLESGFGLYQVEFVVDYGARGASLLAPRTTMIVLPTITTLLAIAAGVFLLIFGIILRARIAVAWSILVSPHGHSRMTAFRALADKDIVSSLSSSEVESILDELDAHVGSRKPKKKARKK